MKFFCSKKRRGQVRAIDFTISLILFVLLFSQLILVLINTRVIVVNNVTKDPELSKLIAERLFGNPGKPNWGLNQASVPSDIGFRYDNPSLMKTYNLDPSKLMRMKSDVDEIRRFSSGLIGQYVSYDTLKTKLSITTDFSITIRSLFSLKLTFAEQTIPAPGFFGYILGEVKSSRGAPVPYCPTSLYELHLNNYTIDLVAELTCDVYGKFNFTLTERAFPYVMIGICNIGASFAYDYVIPLRQPDNYLAPADGIEIPAVVTSSTGATGKIIDVPVRIETPQYQFMDQTILIMSENHSNSAFGKFTVTNIGTFTGQSLAYEFPIPNNGVVLSTIIARSANATHDQFYVTIETIPPMFDGIFGNKIQKTTTLDIPKTASVDEYKTVVYIHGALMEATIWSWEA